MLQRLKRKRGGQVGNQNAVKHDYYTAAACQARWTAWKKLQAEERRRSNERSDHACRIDDLVSNRADDLVSDRQTISSPIVRTNSFPVLQLLLALCFSLARSPDPGADLGYGVDDHQGGAGTLPDQAECRFNSSSYASSHRLFDRSAQCLVDPRLRWSRT
jgi:hypothetical protein